jgi:putative transposase
MGRVVVVLKLILAIMGAAASSLRSRRELALENLALRRQIGVLRRTVGARRVRLTSWDRAFWAVLAGHWQQWKSTLDIVQPATVIRWHRAGFGRFWRWKSRSRRPGRPALGRDIIALIQTMAAANATWGAPRIRNELAMLGIDVAVSTVAKYMPRPRRPPSSTWRAFLDNHFSDLVALDFFVVPTATFRILFGFIMLRHDRRRIVHFSATAHPTAEWTARQIVEAAIQATPPGFLLRDRDQIYGERVRRVVKALGIQEIITAPRSHWQNPYAERLIGSLRRECLDHVIVLDERHLLRILGEYFRYYNTSRCHLSLVGDAPEGRARQAPEHGRVIALPQVGGLHHR